MGKLLSIICILATELSKLWPTYASGIQSCLMPTVTLLLHLSFSPRSETKESEAHFQHQIKFYSDTNSILVYKNFCILYPP